MNKKLTKAEIITLISEKADLTKRDTEKFIKGFEQAVYEVASEFDEMRLFNGFTIKGCIKKGRKGSYDIAGYSGTYNTPDTHSCMVKVTKPFATALEEYKNAKNK